MQSSSSALFSNHPARGMKIRNRVKYSRDATCPMMMKGCSTGMPPIQVRMATSATRAQNKS